MCQWSILFKLFQRIKIIGTYLSLVGKAFKPFGSTLNFLEVHIDSLNLSEKTSTC